MSGKIKNFIEEFKAFALRGNMMDMAVGIIIGGAFTGIVTSLTDNFINPILNFVTGAETYTLQNVAGFASSFVSELVNFFIMAFVLFLLLKGMNKLVALGKKPEAPSSANHQGLPILPERDSYRSHPLPTLHLRAHRTRARSACGCTITLAVHAPAHPFRMPGAFSVI